MVRYSRMSPEDCNSRRNAMVSVKSCSHKGNRRVVEQRAVPRFVRAHIACARLDPPLEILGQALELTDQTDSLVVGAFAQRDIHDGTEHKSTFGRFDRVEADFDGHLGAVPPQAVQITPFTHPWSGRVRASGCSTSRASPSIRST